MYFSLGFNIQPVPRYRLHFTCDIQYKYISHIVSTLYSFADIVCTGVYWKCVGAFKISGREVIFFGFRFIHCRYVNRTIQHSHTYIHNAFVWKCVALYCSLNVSGEQSTLFACALFLFIFSARSFFLFKSNSVFFQLILVFVVLNLFFFRIFTMSQFIFWICSDTSTIYCL